MTDSFDNAPADAAPDAETSGLDSLTGPIEPGGRPSFIPEKFWDSDNDQVRVDALAKSYQALERKLGSGAHLRDADDDEEAYQDADFDDAGDLGLFDPEDAGDDIDSELATIPDRPDAYLVDPGHPWLEIDPQVMEVLHDAGFTHDQAQVVYDLAASHVIPALEQVLSQAHSLRDQEQLTGYFGSNTRYEEAARQISDWGSANLPPEVFAGLSAHPNGVIAMFRLMQSDEPRFLGNTAPAGPVAEADLKKLISDPKYWRDHDPATVKRVEDGFRRLYPERD